MRDTRSLKILKWVRESSVVAFIKLGEVSPIADLQVGGGTIHYRFRFILIVSPQLFQRNVITIKKGDGVPITKTRLARRWFWRRVK